VKFSPVYYPLAPIISLEKLAPNAWKMIANDDTGKELFSDYFVSLPDALRVIILELERFSCDWVIEA
jgi:hypothetical protein